MDNGSRTRKRQGVPAHGRFPFVLVSLAACAALALGWNPPRSDALVLASVTPHAPALAPARPAIVRSVAARVA